MDSSGTFTVTVTDTNGCNGTSSPLSVSVTTNPVAGFTFSSALTTVTFTDHSTGATSWSWTFGDGGTDTIQNPVHAYTNPGTYQVCLVVFKGNCRDSICESVTVTALDRAGIQISDVSIFPNPSTGVFFVKAPEKMDGIITDATGRIVYSAHFEKGINPIDLRNASSGIYLLHLRNGNSYLTMKWVKQDQ